MVYCSQRGTELARRLIAHEHKYRVPPAHLLGGMAVIARHGKHACRRAVAKCDTAALQHVKPTVCDEADEGAC